MTLCLFCVQHSALNSSSNEEAQSPKLVEFQVLLQKIQHAHYILRAADMISIKAFVAVILSVSVSWSFCNAWKPKEIPRVGISKWITLDGEDRGLSMWQSDFDNLTEGAFTILDHSDTFVVSPHLTALAFECNASYPVKWIFQHAEDVGQELYSIRIRTIRTASDVLDSKTFQYSSSLELYGDSNIITGAYTCESVEDKEVQKRIYVFWQGSSPPYLLLAGRVVTTKTMDSETVELPCRISKPDVQVMLMKEVASLNFQPIVSPYIKFDPKIGFVINLIQDNDPYGRYKCMTDDAEDSVIVNVEKGKQGPFMFNETLTGNATIYYHDKEEGVVCCSNSSKPPSLHSVFCFDPVTCKMKEFMLYKVGSTGRRFKNGSCTFEKIYPRDSGILRCKGDGIDVFRNFYTDMSQYKNRTGIKVYFNWKNINPENMLQLTATTKKPFYVKQNVTLSCDTSYFYFSEGIKWAIKWANGSTTFIQEPKDPNFGDIPAQSAFQSIRLRISSNMTSVVCYAPVWNSTEWINKTFELESQESYAPEFEGGTNSSMFQFSLNDTSKTIECKATGTPMPTLRWRRNNRTITNESNISVQKSKNGSSVLTIHRVSVEVHGEYKCIASNFVGKVEKTIQVFVQEPSSSSLGPVSVTFLVILLFGLIAGIGFLAWKMKLQKKIIDHLAGVVFRDVAVATATQNHTTHQTTGN